MLFLDHVPGRRFRAQEPRASSIVLVLTVLIVLVAALSAAPLTAASVEPPVAIRVTWGGGKTASRAGSIRVIDAGGGAGQLDWRMLSPEPDATATMHAVGDTISIHEPRGFETNGVEVRVADWRRARIRVQIAARSGAEKPAEVDVAVADLLANSVQQPLGGDGNRLTLRRASGDELRVALEGAATTVHRPGDTVRLTLHPLLGPQASTATTLELRVRLKRSAAAAQSQAALHSQAIVLEESAGPPGDGPRMRSFAAVPVAVPLPQQEGSYDIECEVVERGGLRWSRTVAARTMQVVAVAEAAVAEAGGDWQLVYELDPGSPKLVERLRRLPGMGMPVKAVGSMALPKMPLPSFTLPKMPIPTPTLPGMPLPSVPVPKLPSVNSMVPRISGLLAVGHSSLEPHQLGPMLKLPPAAGAPAWEGIAVAVAEPGMPYLVEIEYPSDQEMVLGATVIEQPGETVRATSSSGVDLRRSRVSAPVDDGAVRLSIHRFVFWPQTRAPVVLLSNLSARAPAIFGKVRILAGPVRVAGEPRLPASNGSRQVHLYQPTPDFGPFGAADRIDAASHRSVADWNTFLGGVRRSAEWVVAQGAAGAMVGVYADGAACWPTKQTQYAPRWDSGAAFEGALDPVPKDVLDLLCRVYARERLRLVPAIVCNGAVPELDALASGPGAESAGILSLGRDGRPYQPAAGEGRTHYNILDPRVQGAVERLVAELADRLRGAPAVEGVAIVLPHDGWLHVPGVAWGLDDATFARFVADAGADVEQIARPVLAVADSDGRRFAGRAALVEGPLKDRWLTWREGVVAGFYGRLADVIAARQPAWNLYVTPTTLFVAGDLASRFQPLLAGEPEDVDLLRAVAIEPGRIAAHGRIVYVAPHVHGAIDDVVERGVLHGANRSLPLLRGAARAARNGAVLVERPCELDVKPLVAQGAFSAATAEPAAVHAPAAGVGRGEPLAATCIASDIEVVFDMALMHRRVDEDDAVRRRAFESLPAAALEIVGQAPAPLVVRVRTGESGTWVSLVNVCGTACQAVLDCDAVPSGVYDAVTKDALPVGPTGEVMAGLGAWEMKTIVVEGECKVVAARVVFEPGVRDRLKDRLAELHRRRAALEMPAPLAVLDNPTFDLPELGGMVPGWELLEPRRGTFGPVAGKPSAGGKGAVFASANGLATLRSNPFPPPATGRISIAMWVRIAEGSPQPPLRIAIEGVRDDREYYRFAPVGRGAGAMPLTATWAQFVLQVDDLPTRGIESLRVRLDLLGPGSVEIDDVRVFDLAFEESQRVQLSRLLAVADERFVAGDIGGCLVDVESHWPRFLEDFVAPAMPDAPASTDPATASAAGGSKPEEAAQPQRTGVMDRVRRWWQ